jgi:PAS domain S-box-containing protein
MKERKNKTVARRTKEETLEDVDMVEDITERRRAEEALGQSERTLRSMINASCESILLLDTEGTILIANETVAHRLGTTVDAVTGQKIADFVSADIAARRYLNLAEVVRTGKSIRFESERSGRYYENTLSPVLDGEGRVVSIVVLGIDQTGRKRAEEEQRRNRATLQATIECLPFDFFAIGLDGRYILQNAASKQHWGEAFGKLPEEVCTNKRDLAIWLDNNRRAFAGEKIEEDVTLTVEGEQRFYSNVLAPIRDSGETYGVLGLNVHYSTQEG